MARYNSNFLDAVILEVRFEDVSLTPLDKFREELGDILPMQKQEKALEGTVNINLEKGTLEQSKTNKVVWSLAPKDNLNKIVRISQDFINITYTNQVYTNSDELMEDVKNIVSKFLVTFDVKIINRLGLRYVNSIPTSFNNEKVELKELINPELISGYSFGKELEGSIAIARAMSQQVIKYDDGDMNFSFGIWNDDFPNRIVKENFIIDCDCSTNLPVATSEINVSETIKSYNQHIELVFESSIREKVREWMHASK